MHSRSIFRKRTCVVVHGEFVLTDLPSFPRRRESRFVNLIKLLKAGLMNALDSRLPHAGMTKNQRLTIRSNLPCVVVALFALATTAVHAAVDPTPVSTSSALLQGLLGLGMVLAALAAFFWFLRRFSPGQSAAQGAVKVVGGVMLGPRERLVVVEVGDTWLLLGVGGGQVSTLHTLPRPEGYTPAVPHLQTGGLPDFADKLKALLSKRQA